MHAPSPTFAWLIRIVSIGLAKNNPIRSSRHMTSYAAQMHAPSPTFVPSTLEEFLNVTNDESLKGSGNGGDPAAAIGFDPAKTAEAAGAKPTVAHMLGEITWLFSQSATHKHFAIGDLEWMVMPPLMLEQYRVFRGEASPVGVAFWAFLSEEAEAKLEAGGTRLRPDEWKSGDRLWLVDLVAPFATPDNKQTEAMLSDLVKEVFGQRKFKLHRTDPATGKRETVELGGEG